MLHKRHPKTENNRRTERNVEVNLDSLPQEPINKAVNNF